jgi:alginate O-acetyltransferase complex protein AlgI
MLFSSNIFLFLFLPVFLLGYYLIHLHFRNTYIDNFVLLSLSFFFYLWGSNYYFFLLYAAVIVNYLLARWIQRTGRPKLVLGLGIFYNLSLLFYFKYANFVLSQVLDPVLSVINLDAPVIGKPFLPIGISFFTFMAIAYLFDVYRKQYPPASLLNFGLYLSLFPHLVAGPIVRFSDIKKELESRFTNLEYFYEGAIRFIWGLGKKVIIANNLGMVADKVFALPGNELGSAVAWIGIICYTLQIYFDFSGYTDMAIGLARFFGFHFPENFNHPYRAVNLTDFWRRWHMTLTGWFRDYVYIPLGGNRLGNVRTYVNILVIFLLTGIWHGASWTFIVWGVYNGVILVTERFFDLRFGLKLQGWWGNITTLLMVVIGWVFFRASSLDQAFNYFRSLIGLSSIDFEYFEPGYFLNLQTATYLVIAFMIVFIPFEKFLGVFKKWDGIPLVTIQGIGCFLILIYSILLLSKAQFTPFIYFQF